MLNALINQYQDQTLETDTDETEADISVYRPV